MTGVIPDVVWGWSAGPPSAALVSVLLKDVKRLRRALQGVLNWVGQWAPGREPEAFEARLHDVLFRSEEPGDAEDWLGDLNAGNLEVVTDALATPGLAKAAVGDRCKATPDGACGHVTQPAAVHLYELIGLEHLIQANNRFLPRMLPRQPDCTTLC